MISVLHYHPLKEEMTFPKITHTKSNQDSKEYLSVGQRNHCFEKKEKKDCKG
jgi:hypothetical protein